MAVRTHFELRDCGVSAVPFEATSTNYRFVGVSPVFLARTFIAVGPSVTLSW